MAFILYNLSSKTVADLLAYVKDILYLCISESAS